MTLGALIKFSIIACTEEAPKDNVATAVPDTGQDQYNTGLVNYASRLYKQYKLKTKYN